MCDKSASASKQELVLDTKTVREEGGAAEMSPPVSPSIKPFRAKRSRTLSESERILAGPSFYGKVDDFCRQKGHGFINPCDGGDKLFFHISDIEGDVVPVPGDEVTYKLFPIPPKNQKHSAVHVQITRPKPEIVHETWDSRTRPEDF
ncbi:hypothetical protein HELRODRAFT_104567 [Helobdella robusta]|uniref:CSD domain-containing protein n=1 Tax=Helobdella robusta TaxID=6412 RepID=T1EDM4_HELRO|nr:hypothetical protein HELRODRAFT_104567 [Helobdella robusta]ESN89908.1 hypothetical protein HELRODRAFT_104567 [Helobdella robusta]